MFTETRALRSLTAQIKKSDNPRRKATPHPTKFKSIWRGDSFWLGTYFVSTVTNSQDDWFCASLWPLKYLGCVIWSFTSSWNTKQRSLRLADYRAGINAKYLFGVRQNGELNLSVFVDKDGNASSVSLLWSVQLFGWERTTPIWHRELSPATCR